MAAAYEVPSKYDLVISDGSDTFGFVLYDPYTGGDSSNTPQKAVHSFSPNFVPRTNIQGNYGDDAQDFFFSFVQRDWSLGEQQRNAVDEANSPRRYWRGENVDVTEPGRVSLRRAVQSVTFGGSVGPSTPRHKTSTVYTVSSSNLYSVVQTGTTTDIGAHGAASANSVFSDGAEVFIDALRYYGGSFSNFSSSAGHSLCWVNNALYGRNSSDNDLARWSTAGTISSLHSVVSVRGAGGSGGYSQKDISVTPYGGKLAFLVTAVPGGRASLWLYDGTGSSKMADFPMGFFTKELFVDQGTLYIGGYWSRYSGATEEFCPAIYYYLNGTIGLLWKSDTYSAAGKGPAMCSYESTVLFTDSVRGVIMCYNPATGGVHTIGTYTTGSTKDYISSVGTFVLITKESTAAYLYPDDSDYASSGYVTSSLIDFDNSLNKLFRGIKVEFDDASDGNGGTVDIAYRVGDVDGSYTTLQTDVTSGTEYTIGSVGAPISGRSISVKVTLNKGTSTRGPVLKRLHVRGVPEVNSYHRSKHVLALHGKDGSQHVVLRDGSLEPIDGHELAMRLMDFAEANTLLNITDKFGTKLSTIESCEFSEIRPEEYVGEVVFREV